MVDCSGSMQSDQRIEKARLFGALLADAVRGLAGVELHVVGFTERLIYDAGDAERCAVAELKADGGNNDAGGLWYAAQLALASRRRSRLLVMISDGLPTECSVTALRECVTKTTSPFLGKRRTGSTMITVPSTTLGSMERPRGLNKIGRPARNFSTKAGVSSTAGSGRDISKSVPYKRGTCFLSR